VLTGAAVLMVNAITNIFSIKNNGGAKGNDGDPTTTNQPEAPTKTVSKKPRGRTLIRYFRSPVNRSKLPKVAPKTTEIFDVYADVNLDLNFYEKPEAPVDEDNGPAQPEAPVDEDNGPAQPEAPVDEDNGPAQPEAPVDEDNHFGGPVDLPLAKFYAFTAKMWLR
jgi:hypothetical protein